MGFALYTANAPRTRRSACEIACAGEKTRHASERREKKNKKSHHTQLMAMDFSDVDGSYYFSWGPKCMSISMPRSSRTRSFAAGSFMLLASTMATFFRTAISCVLASNATSRSKSPQPKRRFAAAEVGSSITGMKHLTTLPLNCLVRIKGKKRARKVRAVTSQSRFVVTLKKKRSAMRSRQLQWCGVAKSRPNGQRRNTRGLGGRNEAS